MKLHLSQQQSMVTLQSKNSHVQIHMAIPEIQFATAVLHKPIRLHELLRLQSEAGGADGYPETPARMTHLSGVRYDDLDSTQGSWRTVCSRRLLFYSGQHELRDGEVIFGQSLVQKQATVCLSPERLRVTRVFSSNLS